MLECGLVLSQKKTAIDGSKCPISLGKTVAETVGSSVAAEEETVELKQESSQEESQ